MYLCVVSPAGLTLRELTINMNSLIEFINRCVHSCSAFHNSGCHSQHWRIPQTFQEPSEHVRLFSLSPSE